MKSEKDKLELKQGCLLLLSPFIIILFGMFLLVGTTRYYGIVSGHNEYIDGYLEVDSIVHYSDPGDPIMEYNGVGNIVGTKHRAEIYIGIEGSVNFNKKRYAVFYRPDGKYTVRRKENETKFNVTPYIFKFIGYTIVPPLVLILLSFYYYSWRKKIKQIDNQKQEK